VHSDLEERLKGTSGRL
jgi:hypothetical protein